MLWEPHANWDGRICEDPRETTSGSENRPEPQSPGVTCIQSPALRPAPTSGVLRRREETCSGAVAALGLVLCDCGFPCLS